MKIAAKSHRITLGWSFEKPAPELEPMQDTIVEYIFLYSYRSGQPDS